MSFGESVFSIGFNQKTTKEDLFVKENHGILPCKQRGKTLEDSRRLSPKDDHERLTWVSGRPHLQVGRPVGGASRPHMSMTCVLLRLRASWSLLESSHIDYAMEFHNFL